MGITWIGLLYYFNLVQVPAFAEMSARARNEAIENLAKRALWWFRWAAVATVLTGILILGRHEGLLHATSASEPDDGMSISTGILIALIMFVNVWGIIWRNQKTSSPGGASAGRWRGAARGGRRGPRQRAWRHARTCCSRSR